MADPVGLRTPSRYRPSAHQRDHHLSPPSSATRVRRGQPLTKVKMSPARGVSGGLSWRELVVVPRPAPSSVFIDHSARSVLGATSAGRGVLAARRLFILY